MYNLHDLRTVISLVMQEPIIFNYSILENILYGKTDASNSEVNNAAEIANCKEFIENNGIAKFNDTAEQILKEMISNKEALVELIGLAKYEEELELFKQVEKAE